MKASQLIKQLEVLIAEQGDLQVVVFEEWSPDNETVSRVLYSELSGRFIITTI